MSAAVCTDVFVKHITPHHQIDIVPEQEQKSLDDWNKASKCAKDYITFFEWQKIFLVHPINVQNNNIDEVIDVVQWLADNNFNISTLMPVPLNPGGNNFGITYRNQSVKYKPPY